MRALQLIWPLSGLKIAMIIVATLIGLSFLHKEPVLPPDPEQQPVWYIWA